MLHSAGTAGCWRSDVGEASIGWAVAEVDSEGHVVQLVNTEVTLFQSAWSNDSGTYVAHGAADRTVRGAQQRHESSGLRLAGITAAPLGG